MPESKPIKFTRHAKNRMRWRKINEQDVKLAISKPDFVGYSEYGETNAWIPLAEQFLRVTYKVEVDGIIVISVVKKKTLPKE